MDVEVSTIRYSPWLPKTALWLSFFIVGFLLLSFIVGFGTVLVKGENHEFLGKGQEPDIALLGTVVMTGAFLLWMIGLTILRINYEFLELKRDGGRFAITIHRTRRTVELDVPGDIIEYFVVRTLFHKAFRVVSRYGTFTFDQGYKEIDKLLRFLSEHASGRGDWVKVRRRLL